MSGGYLEDDPDAGALLVRSFPYVDRTGEIEGWTAVATDHGVTSPVAVAAYAIGLSRDVLARYHLRVIAGNASGVLAAWPMDEKDLSAALTKIKATGVVTGGGGEVTTLVSNFLFASYPIDEHHPYGWRAHSKDHAGVSAPATMEVAGLAIIHEP